MQDKSNFLDTNTIPTVEELTERFKENDFTTMQVYEDSNLTDDDKAGIAYISDLYNKPWDKLAKEKGLKGHVSCYSKDNPLMLLRNNSARVVSENVYKLLDEYPDRVDEIFEQFAPYFDQPEKADEFLNKGINTAMDVMQFSELAKEVQTNPAAEDFSFKQQNYPRIDFERKWYHTRAKTSVESIEDIDEQSVLAEDVEDVVFSNIRFTSFWNSLNDEDKTILHLNMRGLTQQEIANKIGFADHSAVSKRIKKLKGKFLSTEK